MKKICLCLVLFLMFIPAYSLDFSELQIYEGFWAAMCNDTFGIGNCLETDDLHTYAFHGGLKAQPFYFSFLYDVYTFRGLSDGEQSRTDTALIRGGYYDELNIAPLYLKYGIGVSAGIAGNLGGYTLQNLFHLVFEEPRPIPDAENYDPYDLILGLNTEGDIALLFSRFLTGITLKAGFYAVPLSLSIRSGIFLEWPGKFQSLRHELLWQFSDPFDGSRTLKTVSEYNSGLCTYTTIQSGGLFYQSGYNFISLTADGRIGYSWNDFGSPEKTETFWDLMEAGIEISRIASDVTYQPCASLLLLFGTPVEKGYISAQTKNGILYKTGNSNVSTSTYGAGWEQQFTGNDSAIVPSFGIGILCEIVRELDYREFRSVLQNEIVISGAELRPSFAFFFKDKSEKFDFGFRLSPYIILPVITFGPNRDSAGLSLSQKTRWGFRFGLCTRMN